MYLVENINQKHPICFRQPKTDNLQRLGGERYDTAGNVLLLPPIHGRNQRDILKAVISIHCPCLGRDEAGGFVVNAERLESFELINIQH